MYITKEFDSMSIDRYTQFICKRRCGDEQIHTHLDMFEGKYCITTKNNDHSTFLRLRAAAIDAGFLVEYQNPKDARSKLLGLSKPTRARIDEVFDMAVTEIRKAERDIAAKGSLVDEV